MAAEPKNKKQWIESLAADGDWKRIKSIVVSAGRDDALTLPAVVALAEALVQHKRLDLIGSACDAGWTQLVDKIKEQKLSKVFDPAEAQASLSKGKGKGASLAAHIWGELAGRTLSGEFDLWERWKGSPEYLSRFFGERSQGFALRDLYRKAPVPRRSASGPDASDWISAVPDDLFELLAADAESSRFWAQDSWEPQITEWGAGTFSMNDRMCHPLHDLCYTHAHEPKAVLRALRRLPVSEYGRSGRDPLDSALDAAIVKDDFGLAEAIVAQDPLALIRPRLYAERVGPESDPEWRERVRTPIEAFLNGSNPASGRRHVHGLDSKPVSPSPTGKWHIPVIGRVCAWLDACHRSAGSPEARAEWELERAEIIDKACGGPARADDLWRMAAQAAERSAGRLGLVPVSMPSRVEALSSAGPQARKALELARSILEKAQPSLESSAELSEPASEPAIRPRARRVPDAPVSEFSKAAVKRAFQVQGSSAAQTRSLTLAICQGDAPRALKALAAGADPNGTIGRSDSFLSRARALKDAKASTEIVDALLSAGALEPSARRKPNAP